MRASTVIAYVLGLIIQVAFPIALVLVVRRRNKSRWMLFAYGAITYGVAQLITWLPLNILLDVMVEPRITSPNLAFLWLMAIALLTALFEELGRWLGFRYLFPRQGFKLTWDNGLAFGLGHVATESLFLIAGLTFLNLLAYVVLTKMGIAEFALSVEGTASPALMAALERIAGTHWTQPLVVTVERLLAVPHQIAWTLLVMESLISRQKRWFGLAVLYHTSVAVIVPGLARLLGFGYAELANVCLAASSVWIISRVYRLAHDRE